MKSIDISKIMNDCLICQETFIEKNSYKCPNIHCKVYICKGCIQIWDQMYERLECPICHTSREIPDIENQTQVNRRQERITRINQIQPIETIGMSSRGRMLFIISHNIEEPDFLDNYCNYLFDNQIHCMKKCCKTLNYIILGICFTIVLGFIYANILYLAEYNGSIKKIVNETKDNYKEADNYFMLSINGLCLIVSFFFITGCCINCYEKCK